VTASASSSLTRLRIDHPEWLLGDQTIPWFAASWNFEVPEVREHKRALIEETCSSYDWDGLEMDWQRDAGPPIGADGRRPERSFVLEQGSIRVGAAHRAGREIGGAAH